MALYSIVYWGSITFSNINQKLIDLTNVSIFIKTELTQNSGKYFYLDPIPGTKGQFNLIMNANTPTEIFNLINTLGYNRYNEITDIRIRSPQRINNTNLYKVQVDIEFKHKNLRKVNTIEVYLTANSFKVGLIQPEVPSLNLETFTIVYPITASPTTTETSTTTTSSGGGGGRGDYYDLSR